MFSSGNQADWFPQPACESRTIYKNRMAGVTFKDHQSEYHLCDRLGFLSRRLVDPDYSWSPNYLCLSRLDGDSMTIEAAVSANQQAANRRHMCLPSTLLPISLLDPAAA